MGRVLVLAEYGWRNGGENSLLAVLPHLKASGWQFVIACPGESELSRFAMQHGYSTVAWNVFDQSGIRKSQSEIRSEISDLITSVQPSIVHCNSLSTGRLAGPVTNEMKVPAIGYLRDIIKISRQAISDLNQLDLLIAVSNATRDFHVGNGLLEERVAVVYNGVDLDKFSPGNATGFLHDELGLSPPGRLVLCIGQIGLRKGTNIVIESFIRLARDLDDVQLLLVGMRNSKKQESIEYEQFCRSIVDESGVGNRVHWLGRRTDVDQLFREASLLMHGARQEPLGRVLLEASASGCPVIATTVGGTEEIIADCFPHLTLCSPDSIEQMSIAAKAILDDQKTWSAISKKIRLNAESRFQDHRCARDLDLIYQRIANRT